MSLLFIRKGRLRGTVHVDDYFDIVLMTLQCSNMLEQFESMLEKWWFSHFAKNKNLELIEYLCIDRARGSFPATVTSTVVVATFNAV